MNLRQSFEGTGMIQAPLRVEPERRRTPVPCTMPNHSKQAREREAETGVDLDADGPEGNHAENRLSVIPPIGIIGATSPRKAGKISRREGLRMRFDPRGALRPHPPETSYHKGTIGVLVLPGHPSGRVPAQD